MPTTQERAGVGPETPDTTGEQRGGCEGCHDCFVERDGTLPITWLYRGVLRDRPSVFGPESEPVRYCYECAQFVRAGTNERYSHLFIASDLVGRKVLFRRPIDDSLDTGIVVRDVPAHNSVVIGPSGKGRFGMFERVIHRANVLLVESREGYDAGQVRECREVRRAS